MTLELLPAEAVVVRHALMSYRNNLALRAGEPYPMTDGFELAAADTLIQRLDILSERLLTEDRIRANAPAALASPAAPRPEGPGYGDPDCDHEWSGPLDKAPTCVKCSMAYKPPAAPRSVETAGLREWPDRAWLIAHWVGHRCEMVGCRATKPHEHGGGQPMREMTPEERVAALSPDTTETP